jgi:hypothetical protein
LIAPLREPQPFGWSLSLRLFGDNQPAIVAVIRLACTKAPKS